MKTKIIASNSLDRFPFSTEKGGDSSGINHQKMRLMAEQGLFVKKEQLYEIQGSHYEFLASGGAGGRWKALQVGDIVVGFYESEVETEGVQAIFERMNLTKTSFHRLEFPFSNCCGIFAERVDFSYSNLGYSLLTDSALSKANFSNANLRHVDFSRSDLRGVQFVNADLSNADFENCDLRNANFTGAKFNTARFPGARLEGAICD